MADWPMMGDGQQTISLGATKASGSGVTVTAGAANTKTTNWVVVSGASATPFDAAGIYLSNETNATTVSARFLADLGMAVFGSAANTEVVLISNVYFVYSKAAMAGYELYFPISIPAGSRISMKTQSNFANAAAGFSIRLQGVGGAPSSPRSIVQTLGYRAATTNGQTMATGAANSYGTWTQLTGDSGSAVIYPIEEVILSIQGSNSGSWPGGAIRIWMDIGIGPDSANVTPILEKIPMVTHANPDQFFTPYIGPIPCHIPASATNSIFARYQVSATNTVLPDYVLYGVS